MTIKVRICFLLMLLFPCICLRAKTVYIIIPGTWSGEHGWHSQDGNFFEALKSAVDPLTTSVMTYYWSGKNNHKSRKYAAQGLAKILQSFPIQYTIKLITHSHGSNVGILTSKILGKTQNCVHKITAFYAFATPIDPESYFPNMAIINYFYNFFSFSDFVQTVFGMFKRVYPAHERIANLSVTINSIEPNHDTIHAPCIARWLPSIHEQIPHFTFSLPGSLSFFNNKKPLFSIDTQRENLLEEDYYLTQQYLAALGKKKHVNN